MQFAAPGFRGGFFMPPQGAEHHAPTGPQAALAPPQGEGSGKQGAEDEKNHTAEAVWF